MTDFESVRRLFAPVFDDIAAASSDHDLREELPYSQVEELKNRGFGMLRLPREHGGFGLGYRDFFAILVELAAADPNVAQVFRAHFGFVEDAAGNPNRAGAARILELVSVGALLGNATTDADTSAEPRSQTRLIKIDGRLSLSGRKYYATGSLYADYIGVLAQRGDEERVTVFVPRDHPGVEVGADWDGFGQRLTGSGSVQLHDVTAQEEWVLVESPSSSALLPSLFQLMLTAVQTGIGDRVLREALGYTRERKRTFSNAAAEKPTDDPLVQAIIGRIATRAHTARAVLDRAVEELDRVRGTGHVQDLELAVAQAQIVVSEQVLAASNDIFEIGGASSASKRNNFDRHWRNARTLAVHNPAVQKERLIGRHYLNDVPFTVGWQLTPTRQKA